MKKYEEIFEELLRTEEVRRMEGFDQRNLHHCFDLMGHTMACVEGVGDDPLLRIAALLHDVGKPDCAREKNGRLVFYGHAKKSGEIARELLSGKLSNEEIEYVVKVISHHDDFINSKNQEEYNPDNPWFILITPDSLQHWQEKNGFTDDEVRSLLCLCRADSAAQAEHVYTAKGVELTGCSRAAKVGKIDYIQSVFKEAWQN